MVQNFYKHNNVKALEIITPKFYLQDEIDVSGLGIKLEDQLLNTHLTLANSFSSLFSVSATANVSSINTLSGITPYFIPQNKLSVITPFSFESNILVPLGLDFGNFATSTTFKSYLSGTFLPSIKVNQPTANFATTPSGSHEYLISNLGWFYFLNFSAVNYSPSSFVLDNLIRLYYGEQLNHSDAMKGITNFLWRNYSSSAVIRDLELIPASFVSGADTYTSGTQQLEKLLTLIDVVYTDQYLDFNNTYIQTAFENYLSTGIKLDTLESKGALYKLLKAISYLNYDIDNDISRLQTLFDIDKCPDDYLPYLADLIGWRLFGYDANRWRLQLKSAAEIYKAKGTKRSVQLALDSIFSENFFNLSASIKELHESYIPHLIYYSLATESPLLKSYSTWSRTLATSLGINDYSTTNFDTNIRYVVDYIIFEAARKFPDLFKLGNSRWPLFSSNFTFKYRNRVFFVPPFEEINYYKDLEVTSDLIDFIIDRLACFNISTSFLDQVRLFIRSFTVDSQEILHADNRWLMLYEGLQVPPNYNSLLSEYENSKIDYLGLWSADSSHYNLDLYASSFTFDNRSLITSSTLALQQGIEAVNSFAPAHSIPDTNLILSENDFAGYQENTCPSVEGEFEETYPGSGVMAGFYSSGVSMTSLNRVFGRGVVDQFSDAAMSSSSITGSLPRTSFRRRSLHNVLPKNYLYTRTGFNAPLPLYASTIEYSYSSLGYLPLGYIPSANEFVSIDNVSSIPDIYSKCETLNSSSIYSGLIISATFPSRGLDNLAFSACTRHTYKGETNEIFPVIYNVLYNREKQYWQDYLDTAAGWSALGAMSLYMDIPTSYANSSFAISSFTQYDDFEFGRGAHKIYNDWSKYFNRNQLTYRVLEPSAGNGLFNHIYGSIIPNSKFDLYGSAVTASPSLIASSYSEPSAISNISGSGVLSLLGAYTYIVSSFGVNFGNEFRNKEILKNVEIVNTSGASQNNAFFIYKINRNAWSKSYSPYMVENPVIKQRAINGFPRIVYHLSALGSNLIPNHEFELSTRYLAGLETGTNYGGGGIGVWIHTEPENNMIWSWTPAGKWEKTDITSSLNLLQLRPYMHLDYTPVTPVPDSATSSYIGQCYNNANPAKLTLENITLELFKEVNVNFNTKNQPIELPQEYFKNFGQVHRFNQKYVVEIFKIAENSPDSYVLFDDIDLMDTTLNTYAEEYTPEQLLISLNFMKDIANDRASRRASVTSGTYGTSGGSRINYREFPAWNGGTYGSIYTNSFRIMELIN
jgi:hypothetical protein